MRRNIHKKKYRILSTIYIIDVIGVKKVDFNRNNTQNSLVFT